MKLNFYQAQKKARSKKMIGILIVVPTVISTIISILKMLYFRMDNGSKIGGAIAGAFKNLVSPIYENTQFLNFFWTYSPTPDQMHLGNPNNIYFIIIYMAFFVGIAFLASGKKLTIRLIKISEKIENQIIEASIRGKSHRTREQIEQLTDIPSPSIFSQFHQLYFAPVVTAVIGAILIKTFSL